MLRPLRSRALTSRASTVLGLLGLLLGGFTCASQAGDGGSGGAGGTGGASASSGSGGASTGPGSTSGAGGAGMGGAGAAGAAGSSGGASVASSSTGGTTTGSGGAATASSGPTTTTTTTGTGGAGGTGGAAGAGGAVAAANTILSFSADGNDVVGESYDVATKVGFANPFTDVSTDAISLAFTGDGNGVAVLRSMASGELHYARYFGGWFPGFGAVLPAVLPGLFIVGGPSIAGGSTQAHAVFQGTDLKFYYAQELGGSWLPTNEPIQNGNAQATGPVPPAVAAILDVPTVAFVGTDGDLYDQSRTGGTWQPANAHGVPGHGASVTPAIVALKNGAELVLVYTDSAANGLWFTTRTAGTWTAPAAIAGASSNDQVSMAPLTAGGAVLSYRGTDGLLYTSLLSAMAPYTWTAPVVGVTGSNPTLQSPPAVATGASGAEAELLYLDTAYILYSARMTGGVWGSAGMNGAASYRLALATGP